MANLILNGSNAPLRSWGGSAAKGGSPHERLHQDNVKHLNG
ncbi:hypothetical protein [Moorena sp. SIO1F2]|nr:hypothetical protein [Moorena sp. SIO1F2]